ncbi:hypothetical protein AAG906_022218 [Vitis piasezkii]
MAGFVGEAVLSGFIQKLVDMVASPELWKYAREEQVDSELNEWKKILMKIYAVLHDAEDKQMTNPLVKMWLHDLRDLAYDVEDILDEFATQALRRNLIVAQPQPPTGTVQSIFSSLSTSLTLSAAWSNLSMGSKIEEITARLQDISAQKKHLDLRDVSAGWSGRKRLRRLPSTSLVIESRIYGRETEKAAILAMLLKDDPSDDEVCVIPIVGMGGIGKTTLAQLAFNDDKVKDHFDLRAWVCVSDDFDVLRVTKTILQSLSPHTRYANNLNLLQIELREKLYRKKFLLILDDVWNENFDEWDILCMPMRAGASDEEVEPFPFLRELTIRRCSKLGIHLPDCLPSLVKLDIFGLEECKGLVFRSGVDSCLETLAIGRCHWLVTLDEQMLPCKLKILKIQDCANLEKLPNGLRKRCPKLVSFPEAAFSPLLRSLVLQNCPSLICFPNGELPATTLKHLRVEHCENLESLPEEMMHHKSSSTVGKTLVALKNFTSTLELLCIWGCANLESISEKMSPNGTALEYLDIRGYPNLKILPECLTNLKELHIEDCGGLECFPKRGLSTPNLMQLRIWRCVNLRSLPPQMKNLTSVHTLSIRGCPGVESFPEGGLPPNLTSLYVGCMLPNMVSFSDEECLLPPSLTYLYISDLKSLTSWLSKIWFLANSFLAKVTANFHSKFMGFWLDKDVAEVLTKERAACNTPNA